MEGSAQRSSRDIDIVTPLSLKEVNEVLSHLQAKFAGTSLEIKPYLPPKARVPELPMVTYDVFFESVLPRAKGFTRDFIKIDIISEDVKLPVTAIRAKDTPVFTVKNARCVSLGALSADKLQTLASKTIGTTIDDVPKQLYDIDHLLFGNPASIDVVKHMMYAYNTLAKQELKFKKRKESPIDVLDDIVDTLAGLALVDIEGNKEFKKSTRDFQAQYLRKESVLNVYGWGERVSRIKFLCLLLKQALEDKINEREFVDHITKASEISTKLPASDKVLEARLVELIKPKGRVFRGKPLRRIFWHAVTPTNLYDLPVSS